MRTHFQISFIALLAVTVVLGCGSGNKRAPISGTVTYQGAPLEHGSLTFLAATGPVGGAMIRDGKFQMPAEMGLEPGTYRVSISSPKGPGERTPEQIEAGASTPAKERIPPEFNTETKLTVEVTKNGPNDFHFTID